MFSETNRPYKATTPSTGTDDLMLSDNAENRFDETQDVLSIDCSSYNPYDDDDPLNGLSTDDAVWAYQKMPHDELPVWQPTPTRPWLEPLIRLALLGSPIINNWLQNKPLWGALPESIQSGLAVDNAWIRLYTSMNDAANRELLIGLLNSELDTLARLRDVENNRYSMALERGRKLVRQLEDTFADNLSESLAKDIIDYHVFLSSDIKLHSPSEAKNNELQHLIHWDVPIDDNHQLASNKAIHNNEWPSNVTSGDSSHSPLISVVVGGAAVAGTTTHLNEAMNMLHESTPVISRLSNLVTAISKASGGWRQRTALGGIIFGTSAIALAIYHWIYGSHNTTHAEVSQNISNPAEEIQQQQEWQAISQLLDHIELPYLDFLFYEEPNQFAPLSQKDDDIDQAHVKTTRKSFRSKRDTPSPEIISFISQREGTRRFISHQMGLRLLERLTDIVRASSEMLESNELPQYERDVIYLLKLIEVTQSFIHEHRHIANSDHSLYLCTTGFLISLQEVADSLSRPFGVAKVAEFKLAFGLNSNWLPTIRLMTNEVAESGSTENEAHPATTPVMMLTPEAAIDLYGEKTLSNIERSYDPILNLSDYIDVYIDNILTEFNRKNNTHFSKDDHITIEVRKKPTGVILTSRLLATLTFSMVEIAIGKHRLQIKSTLSDFNVDKTVAFEQYVNNLERDLAIRLWESDLQENMLLALNKYRGEMGNEKRKSLYKHYSDNILSHCLAYLDSPKRMEFTSLLVEQFISGNNIAKEVLFHGVPLNGAFMLQKDSVAGILFSIDEPNFFHVYATHARAEPGIRNAMESQITNIVYNPLLPLFPNTTKFREWVFNRLPLADAERLKHASFYGELDRQWIDPIISSDGFRDIPISPFTFRYTEGIDSISKISLFNLLQRLESDIDSLVHSPGEVAGEESLENTKSFLLISSLALNFFMGVAPSNSLKLIMLIANMSLDIGYVLATLAQSNIVDDTEKKNAYAREAVISGVVSGILNFSPTIQLGASGVKRSLNIYRGIKAAARNGVPELLAKRSWAKLSINDKLDALKHIVQGSDDARTLERLMDNSPDALSQAIHRALPEESALQDMKKALQQVQTKLKLDVANLQRPRLQRKSISFSGHRSVSNPPLNIRDPQSFLGPDGAITYAEQKLTIHAHGVLFGINNMSGKQLSNYIKRYLVTRNINLEAINIIDLRSCYSAYGGRFSTAQVLANRLEKYVRGYPGTITDIQANIPDMGRLFRSDRVSRNHFISSERGHMFFHQTSALILRMRNALRRVARFQRSIPDISTGDAPPPEFNMNYKEYLSDIINLIEGRINATDFGMRHNINATLIDEQLSPLNPRADISDEALLLAFNTLFYPGDNQKPSSTLFNKLMEYDNTTLNQIAMEYFKADDVSSNQCAEIARGQDMSINYIVDTELGSENNWIGVYHANDVAGIDKVIAWKYLPFSEGQINIDTTHFDAGKYVARFFYHNSYNELDFKVYFNIIEQNEDPVHCRPSELLT